MDELVSAVIQRIGAGNDRERPQLLVSFQYFNIMLGCLLPLLVPLPPPLPSLGAAHSSLCLCMFFQYDDDDGDRVLLASDSDLVAAVSHSRSAGQKVMVLACVGFVCWI